MKTKFLLVWLLLALIAGFSKTFAEEINSTNITQAPYSCATWATSCDLTQKSITSIASGTFRNHSNLQILYLFQNQISSVENWDFFGLTSLNSLDLSDNHISSIWSGSFSWLSNLDNLWLGQNYITSIDNGDFFGLSNLTQLLLFLNYINSIDSGAFMGLSNIRELNLTSNYITSIEPGDFNWLFTLHNLLLNNNYINSIENGDFNWLSSNLTSLLLSNNNITFIEPGAFNLFNLLYSLDLSENPLTFLNNSLFSNMTDIREFFLTNTCFAAPIDINLSYCSDNAYVNQTSCEFAGSCVDGSSNILSQYTDRALCEGNYTCSDSQYTDQISCQWAGYCSNGQYQYTDESSCTSNGFCSNSQYSDQMSCESAWYCIDASWSILSQYTNQMSCESEYSCSNGFDMVASSCQGNGGTWAQNQWQLYGEYWSYYQWNTYWNQWTPNQRNTAGNVRYTMAQITSDNNYCSMIESNDENSFISALKWAYLENNYYITSFPISFISSPTNEIIVNTTMIWSGSGIEVEYDSGTIITTNNQPFTGILLQPVSIATGAINSLDNVISATKFGDNSKSLAFSKPVTVRLPAPGKSLWSSVAVYYSQDLNTSRYFHTRTTVINIWWTWYVEFTTNHATYFAIGEEIGSFVINNDSSSTTSQSVTLNISGAGITHMRFSNDNDFTWVSWIPYSTSQARTLSAGAWTKTVYAQFDTNSDSIFDAATSDSIIYNITQTITWSNQWQISLEILSGVSQCIYGTSLSLGNQNVKFNTGYTFTGDFGSWEWSCTDYKAGSGSRTFTIQASDLSNWKGNSISATWIEINHSAATISWEPKCKAWYASWSNWTVISTPYTIMEREVAWQQTCQVSIPTVNLKIWVWANQAPGTYSGTLTLTIPSF